MEGIKFLVSEILRAEPRPQSRSNRYFEFILATFLQNCGRTEEASQIYSRLIETLPEHLEAKYVLFFTHYYLVASVLERFIANPPDCEECRLLQQDFTNSLD